MNESERTSAVVLFLAAAAAAVFFGEIRELPEVIGSAPVFRWAVELAGFSLVAYGVSALALSKRAHRVP